MQYPMLILIINIALYIPETLLAGWLVRGIVGRFLEPKHGKIRLACVVVLLGIFASQIVPIGEMGNAIGILIALVATVFVFYSGSILQRSYVSLLTYAIVTSGRALIDALIMNDTQYYIFLAVFAVLALLLSQTKWRRRLLHMLVVLVATVSVHTFNIITAGVDFPTPYIWYVYVLLLFTRKVVPQPGGVILSSRLWGLLNMLAMPSFVSVITMLVWGRWLYGEYAAFYMSEPQVMIMGFSTFSSVAVLIAMSVLARQYAETRERELLRARESYYEQLEQNQRQIRTLRHDMANHLQALANLRGEEAEQYLNQLIGLPAISGGVRFCENETANTILSVKAAEMQESRVPYEIDAALPASLTITAVDLCALIGNLLDNAIEASRRLPEDRRGVKLSARADKGLFALKVENNYDGELSKQGDLLQTSKADKANHGLGLAGVRDIAKRYHGEVSGGDGDGRFVCVVRCAVPVLHVSGANA
jgi:signal transduction histidine kinase